MRDNDPPIGAMPEDARLELNRRSVGSHYRWTGKNGYYFVDKRTGNLIIGGLLNAEGNCRHHFSFDWRPSSGYYFTNYWFAYGYSRRLQEEINAASSET